MKQDPRLVFILDEVWQILTDCLMLIGMIACGLFVGIDSWFLPREYKMGRVISKHFTPSHSETILIFDAAVKTTVPHYIFHPDDWSVIVDIDGQQDSTWVSKEMFDSLSESDLVATEYVTGRLSGGLYVKSLLNEMIEKAERKKAS